MRAPVFANLIFHQMESRDLAAAAVHRYVCPELAGYQVTNEGALHCLFATRIFSEDTIERDSAASRLP